MANGKTNWKMIGVIATIVIVVVGAAVTIVVAAVRVESKVESHAEQAEKDLKANELVHTKLEGYIKEVDGECQGLGNDIIEIKTQITFIREDMTEILTYIRGLPK